MGALATTAPPGSETVPVIVPRSLCATAVMAISRQQTTTKASLITFSPLTPSERLNPKPQKQQPRKFTPRGPQAQARQAGLGVVRTLVRRSNSVMTLFFNPMLAEHRDEASMTVLGSHNERREPVIVSCLD